MLEVEFLFDLEFDLAVHPQDCAAFTADLLAFAADRSLLPSEPPHPEGWPASNQNPPVPITRPSTAGGSIPGTDSRRHSPAAAAAADTSAGAALATAAAAFCGIGSPRFKRTSLPTRHKSPPRRSAEVLRKTVAASGDSEPVNDQAACLSQAREGLLAMLRRLFRLSPASTRTGPRAAKDLVMRLQVANGSHYRSFLQYSVFLPAQMAL